MIPIKLNEEALSSSKLDIENQLISNSHISIDVTRRDLLHEVSSFDYLFDENVLTLRNANKGIYKFKLILIIFSDNSDNFDHIVEKYHNKYKNHEICLVTNNTNYTNWGSFISEIHYCSIMSASNLNNEISEAFFSQCVVYIDNYSNFKYYHFSKIALAILSKNIPELTVVKWPKPNRGKSLLFIFPDRMIPIQRAFQKRGFDLIRSLADENISLYVLLFGPINKDLLKIKKWLMLFAKKVFTSPLSKGNKTLYSKTILRAYDFLLGKDCVLSLSDRIKIFNTKSNRKSLVEALKYKNYDFILTTCVWTVPTVNYLSKKMNQSCRVIIDLHDIFYIISKIAISNPLDMLLNSNFQKRKEIQILNSVDACISISPSDKQTLIQDGVQNNVLNASGNFDDYKINYKANLPLKDSVIFGYIGTNNIPNKLAINYLKEILAREIINVHPGSKIRIAGSACKLDESLQLKALYPKNIELLGFVESLEKFYSSCNVICAPVFVRGGLNFKSVEALMSGCELLTTRLGSMCLASEKGVWVLDKNDLRETIIRSSEMTEHLNRRKELIKHYHKYYGNRVGYRELYQFLKGTYIG